MSINIITISMDLYDGWRKSEDKVSVILVRTEEHLQ